MGATNRKGGVRCNILHPSPPSYLPVQIALAMWSNSHLASFIIDLKQKKTSHGVSLDVVRDGVTVRVAGGKRFDKSSFMGKKRC